MARTNILRSIARYNDGASYAVKRAFYTHAIRSLIDYSAPCLITASPNSIQRLEKLQNQSLRLILSAPKWSKILNLRAESQLPSIHNRITALTSSLIAKMAHSPRPSTQPAKVLAAAERDPTLFTRRTWAREAAVSITEARVMQIIRAKGKDVSHPDYSPAPPWCPPLPNIQDEWLTNSKSTYNPHVLRAESLSLLGPLTEAHEITIYTDRSVEHDTGAAGAAFVCGEITRQWRVSDGASSLQTELVAIGGALEHVLDAKPRTALIATDSKASLQSLKRNQPSDNIRLVTRILHLAQQLKNLGVTLTLLWIPGHAAIKGNELADLAARAASSRPFPDVVLPPSLAQVKSLIRRNVRECELRQHAAEVADGSRSAIWYADATNLLPLEMPAAKHPRIRADIHRLRLGYHCATEIFRNQAICNHCETPTAAPLLHYILQCRETASIRRERNYPDEDEDGAMSTAARLLANIPMHRLIKLVQETPPPQIKCWFLIFFYFF